MRIPFLTALILTITGCSTGIVKGSGDYPTETFVAPVSYQAVHRNAENQARHCRQMADMTVTGSIYTDNQTSNLRISLPGSGLPVAEIEAEAMGADQSRVTVTVWGLGVWDDRQIAAIRKSIESGEPVCRE